MVVILEELTRLKHRKELRKKNRKESRNDCLYHLIMTINLLIIFSFLLHTVFYLKDFYIFKDIMVYLYVANILVPVPLLFFIYKLIISLFNMKSKY